MKSMKHLALVAVPALLAGLAGCQKTETPPAQQQEENQNDIVFEVKASSVTADGATITTTHNGSDKNTYYGFYYTDLETNAVNAINREVANLTEKGTDLSKVVTTGKTNISVLKDLEPLTSYRYVVFGLNTDGTTYGTPASVEFTTLKGNVTFTVSVSNITETTANATVKSTGDNTDTWYCFATTDLTSELSEVVNAEVEKLGQDVATVIKSGNTMVQMTGLTAGTRYRVVVTGLKSDGTTYGTPVSAEFKTTAAAVEYRENENWTVAYVGKGTYNGIPVDMISVTSTDDERYFTAVVTEEEYTTYTIEEITQASIAINEEDYGSSWVDIFSYTGSVEDDPWSVFESGYQYRALALGIDNYGNATGLYAVSEAFTPEELEASEGYNKWIGDWRIEDNAGNGYDLSIEAYSPDLSYIVTGWQSGLFRNDVPMLANYNSGNGALEFVSNQNLGEVTITTQNGQEIDCSLALLGVGNDDNIWSNPTLATATLTNDTNANVTGEEFSYQGKTYNIVQMQFMALPLSGGNSVYALDNREIPSFPLTMTKSAAAGTAKAVRIFDKIGRPTDFYSMTAISNSPLNLVEIAR